MQNLSVIIEVPPQEKEEFKKLIQDYRERG